MRRAWRRLRRAIRRAFAAVVAVVVQAANILKEVVNRGFLPFPPWIHPGILDLFASLFGLQLPKKLRLRVVILRDEHGKELVSQAEANEAISLVREIFWREARTRIVGAGGDLVRTLGRPAPGAALDVRCDPGEWEDDIGDAGAYFRQHSAYNVTGVVSGYAAPITVFMVRSVSRHTGCSLGVLADYVTLEARKDDRQAGRPGPLQLRVRPRVMAHEMGHACGLLHRKVKDNLMDNREGASGTNLERWQAAWLRNSRHVAFA